MSSLFEEFQDFVKEEYGLTIVKRTKKMSITPFERLFGISVYDLIQLLQLAKEISHEKN